MRPKKNWQWFLGGLMMALIAAGCAGRGAAGDSSAADQGTPAAMQELPASTVTVEPEQDSELEPEPESYIHTVSLEGETLSLIAKWYTGDLGNWKALAEANPGIDPNRIFMGDEILIPEDLLVTRDPMPQSFLDQAYSKKKPAA